MSRVRILLILVLFVTGFKAALAQGQHRRAQNRGLSIGERLPEIELKTIDGKTIDLQDVLKERPVVLETGSYTCPVFRSHVRGMEKLYQEFKDRVAFFIVYTPEAHPRDVPSYFSGRMMKSRLSADKDKDQARSYEERVDTAGSCIADMRITIPVLVDNMNNEVTELLGTAPNAAYLIDQNGKIIARYGWLDVSALEQDLKALSSVTR